MGLHLYKHIPQELKMIHALSFYTLAFLEQSFQHVKGKGCWEGIKATTMEE